MIIKATDSATVSKQYHIYHCQVSSLNYTSKVKTAPGFDSKIRCHKGDVWRSSHHFKISSNISPNSITSICCTTSRVRTILVLGYWVLGNIHRYWVVLLLGDICCCSDTQYSTNQRAVNTVHMPVNDYLAPLLTCTLSDIMVCLDTILLCCCLLNTIIVIIIEFWDISWSLLRSTQYTSIGTGIGYWYH